MKIQTMIMLGSEERHILKLVEESLNLVGWHRERNDDLPEIKAARRLRSDQFSMNDVALVGKYIQRKADEILARANEGGIFSDPKTDATFIEGMRSTAALALRKWSDFHDQLHEYLHEHVA